MLTPKLTTVLKSLSDLALRLFWDLHVLKTAVCPCVCKGVDVLSQVHSENMHRENSSPGCNDWVIDDDAAINGKLPSGWLQRATASTDADSHYGLGRADWLAR